MAEKRRTKPPHEPTNATRDTVQMHTLVGTPQSDVARVIGIDQKTLRKYYREELDLAKARANARVGGALFNKAISGDTTAMIFWMKTQAGWREKGDAPVDPGPVAKIEIEVVGGRSNPADTDDAAPG